MVMLANGINSVLRATSLLVSRTQCDKMNNSTNFFKSLAVDFLYCSFSVALTMSELTSICYHAWVRNSGKWFTDGQLEILEELEDFVQYFLNWNFVYSLHLGRSFLRLLELSSSL